jgi:magnesium transporter
VIVDCARYQDGCRVGGRLTVADLPADEPEGSFVWVGLFEPTAAELAEVQTRLPLPDLAVEDALEARQRPKLERYGDAGFMVLTTARYDDASERVDFGEIQVFIGPGYVVHVRHGSAAPLADVRRALEADPALLRCGPAAVLHAIVDRVVDDYEPVVTGLQDDVGEVELEVFSDDGGNPVQRIYFLKREVVATDLALSPLVQPLLLLATEPLDMVDDELRHHFRDVHDHLARLVAQVDTFSDLLNSVLEANLTRVSVKQNEDMRKISAWVAIAAVPTMIAAIYGMNFDDMPELHSPLGYPIVLSVMAATCVFLYFRFRKSGWL